MTQQFYLFFTQKKWEHMSIKVLYGSIQSSLIYSSPKLEIAQCPLTGEWIYFFIFIQCNATQQQKQWTTDIATTGVNVKSIKLNERSQM